MRRVPAAAAACVVFLSSADSLRTHADAVQAPRALIVSVDGLRGDLILDADVPHLRGLMARGAYTLDARTIETPYTVPAHVSMLTGALPEKHGVTWNDHIEGAYPEVPTLFELARRAGHTTALVAGKTKLVVLTKPGTLNWSHVGHEGYERDADIARRAAGFIRSHRPQLMFVHLGDVDAIGHEAGWRSGPQLRAVEAADHAIGDLLEQLSASGLSGHTTVIVTADHGGSGDQHLPDDPLSRQVPWIVAGPCIRSHVDIGAPASGKVSILATFTVISALFDLDDAEHTNSDARDYRDEVYIGGCEPGS